MPQHAIEEQLAQRISELEPSLVDRKTASALCQMGYTKFCTAEELQQQEQPPPPPAPTGDPEQGADPPPVVPPVPADPIPPIDVPDDTPDPLPDPLPPPEVVPNPVPSEVPANGTDAAAAPYGPPPVQADPGDISPSFEGGNEQMIEILQQRIAQGDPDSARLMEELLARMRRRQQLRGFMGGGGFAGAGAGAGMAGNAGGSSA